MINHISDWLHLTTFSHNSTTQKQALQDYALQDKDKGAKKAEQQLQIWPMVLETIIKEI